MFVAGARYRLGGPTVVLARYAIKAWDPDAHPRDPRTGRFIRNPASAAAGRPARRRRTISNHSASARTRQAISRAQKTLPGDRDGWRSHVVKKRPAERRIDRLVADGREKVADLEAQIRKVEADLAAEFRRKRTPKAKREEIIRQRTSQGRGRLAHLQDSLARLERDAADPDLETSTSNSDRFMAEMLSAEEQPNYPKDPNGKPMPPEAYNKALDAVLDAGRQVYDDYTDSVQRDRQYREIQRQLDEGEFATAKILDAVKAGNSEERQRLVAGRAELFRDMRRREQALLLELLQSIRPMGGVKHTEAAEAPWNVRRDYNALAARPDWEDRLREAERVFPADWLRRSAGVQLHLGSSSRAWHLADTDREWSVLAMPTEDRDGTAYTGGFRDHTAEVNVHEMGHRMEMLVPGLKELEFTLIRRRSAKDGRLEDAQKLRDLVRGSGYRDDEVAYPDDWRDAYIGKTYERATPNDPARQSWEVFQVGLQDTLGRGHKQYGDEELQHFTLGVLATLALEEGSTR